MIGIRRDVLERSVLDGLTRRLKDPAVFQEFVRRFTSEWSRQQADIDGERKAIRTDLQRVTDQIERLANALVGGTPAAAVTARLQGLEQRRQALETKLAARTVEAPRLDDAAGTRERIHAVVEAIELVPVDGRLDIKVRGKLAAILALAGAGSVESASALAEQVELVAGIGFEPMTFRL